MPGSCQMPHLAPWQNFPCRDIGQHSPAKPTGSIQSVLPTDVPASIASPHHAKLKTVECSNDRCWSMAVILGAMTSQLCSDGFQTHGGRFSLSKPNTDPVISPASNRTTSFRTFNQHQRYPHDCTKIYPLVNQHNHGKSIFNGTKCYKLPFSIAVLNIVRL